MNIEIFIENKKDLYDLEERWYITSVYVKKNNNYYNMSVFYMERLLQEFNDSVHQNEELAIDPNLIIISKPTKEKLIEAILEQNNYYFYERLKECEVINNSIMYSMSDAQKNSGISNKLSISIDIDKLVKIY